MIGPGDATAAKKTAKATVTGGPSYLGGILRVDWKLSSPNRHCRDFPRSAQGKFFIRADPEYDAPSDSGLVSYAETDFLQWKCVGRAHFRFEVPGAATFATHFPDGRYSGTYAWETWWNRLYGPGHSVYDVSVYGKGGQAETSSRFATSRAASCAWSSAR